MTASLMTEMRGFLDAVETFETSVARWFGIDQSDLRWFTLLPDAEDGMNRSEIEATNKLSVEGLGDTLSRLEDAGHVHIARGEEERVTIAPSARAFLAEVYASIDVAYVGLYRYRAEELGVVRKFLRTGREFYERQLRQFEKVASTHPRS